MAGKSGGDLKSRSDWMESKERDVLKWVTSYYSRWEMKTVPYKTNTEIRNWGMRTPAKL